MAEIGLAASIIGVAAFGASVAATLYETTDNMRNANQQMRDLAKHVTHFTAVLNHMGQVLKTEKANCSEEVLRDIRKIKHSCKRTFKDIKSTVKTKHLRRVMWLLKKSKAMELEARLDSQQSMLQCIIHTLTVSKLSHIDSRSKEDSEHITGLKVEIKLLKTFIKESYDDLIALRRAEQSNEGDRRPLIIDSSYRDGNTFPSDPVNRSNAAGPPMTWSPSPTSNASKSKDEEEDEDSSTNDLDDHDDQNDVTSTTSRTRNDRNHTGPKRDASSAKALSSGVPLQSRPSYNDSSAPDIHRESNLLLQMVPYRPADSQPILSDRLISDWHGPDESDPTPTTQEVAKSVRLLLDKWTTSGSAPISNILDEEAAREGDEAKLANKQRILDAQIDTQFDTYRNSSPVAEFEERETHPVTTQYFCWPSYDYSHPPIRRLGDEILTEIRSLRGGIHYTKSNNFAQVHFVDQHPIYQCRFVPRNMIPYDEDDFLSTELGRGLVRREALDLLAYSYTETETGDFSISDDIALGQIEELVRLSYQALERNLEERSKRIIKERGFGEAIDAMNRRKSRMRSNQAWAAPPYLSSKPKDWDRKTPLVYRGDIYRGDISPRESTQAQTSFSRLHTPKPFEGGRTEKDAVEETRSEVRFTIPGAQLVSDFADTAKKADTSSARPVSVDKVNAELQSVRLRLERAKKRKEEAEKAKDIPTVFDLTNFVIPDVEADLKKVLERQREAQDSRPHHTEVETECESSDDERGSEVAD